jgi:hypothetical protein
MNCFSLSLVTLLFHIHLGAESCVLLLYLFLSTGDDGPWEQLSDCGDPNQNYMHGDKQHGWFESLYRLRDARRKGKARCALLGII